MHEHFGWKKMGSLLQNKGFLDQKRLIFERQWLSHVELEEIRRIPDNSFDLSVFE